MDLRQQIIDERVDALAKGLGVDSDIAFMRLAHSLITNKSVHAFDETDIVDGGQDKQLDVISIEEDGHSADLFVLQTKNTDSFSSNALIQLSNGLKWLFQRPRKEVEAIQNPALRDRVLEYRALQSNLGPSNIRVHVRFVTNGKSSKISDEFRHELATINSEYSNDTFETFTARAIGCDELIDLSKIQERQSRRVNSDIKIKYDANNPSLIKYYAHDLKGLVCSVPAAEIAKLVNDNPDGAVFDLNIRRFLGSRGAVNKDIQATCTSVNSSYEFWFLNNGITIVCDSFDPVTDPDNPHIKLKNLQIVNGCQTATTVALAQKEGKLAQDVRILTRIYETTEPDLVNKIVLTTNNQNQISSRDLRANDPAQVDMEEAFKIYGYKYERRPRQFDLEVVQVGKLFTNEYVAQAYLAVVLKTPSDARTRKYKVWGELHSKIFSGGPVEPYIVSAVVCTRVSDWLRLSGHVVATSETERLLAKRGSFHIGRIATFLWRGTDDWGKKGDLKERINQLETSPKEIEKHFAPALDILATIISSSSEHSSDVDKALKSTSLDKDIDKRLHTS